MRGLLSILSLFCNEFNKFNKTGTNVRFYLSYDIKITLKYHFLRIKELQFCHYIHNGIMDVIMFHENL